MKATATKTPKEENKANYRKEDTMENIYNYKENITLTKTANGDAVITMNKAILDEITCMLYDATNKAHHDGHEATAKDWQRLVKVLVEKEKEVNLW